jgi:GAT domain
LHLPAIVDASESSPTAAKEAAATIRRYLSKEYYQKGYSQYNAIMLARILTDNPGQPFTQNFDDKFVATVKKLLREGKDNSVQQILRETLDYFEVEKAPSNDSLGPLIQMWRKEKGATARLPTGPVVGTSDVFVPGPSYTHTSQYSRHPPRPPHQSRPPPGLPPPDELAARIEEAKTTARLLVQTVQSTPQSELPANELVKEFAERARAAHKSIQKYMNCENPSPDEDTMLTLIETNDQLNVAMSKHQRSLLQARKAAGMGTPSPQLTSGGELNSYMGTHRPGQNVYAGINAPQPNLGPYSSSPPKNNSLPAPLEPQRNEQFFPPPGPPPSQRQLPQTFNYEDGYSAPSGPPPVPIRNHPESQTITIPVSPVAPTSSAAYGVAENPFADDAYAADSQPPQQKYSLFDRAKHHISPSQTQPEPPSQTQTSRPSQFQPTPSYTHRQESSENNVTMHGGSHPPAPADRWDVQDEIPKWLIIAFAYPQWWDEPTLAMGLCFCT